MVESSFRDAEEVVEHVLRAAARLQEVLASHFAGIGLNEVRFTVLRIIADSLPAGCSQAELARRLEQTESSVSTLIDRMRAGGLLYRLRSKTDRRKRVLMLTEEGRRLHDLARESYGRQMSELLKRLEAGQTATLAHLLRLLVDELTQSAAVAVPDEAESGKGIINPGSSVWGKINQAPAA